MKYLNSLIAVLFIALSSCSTEGESSSNVLVENNSQEVASMIIPDGMYMLTKVESVIIWTAKKINGSGHTGTISTTNGKMKVMDGEIKGGIMTIDMNTFTCTDLEGEDKEGFESHLKSEDFLDVEKFPTSDIKIISVTQQEDKLISQIKLQMHGSTVEYETPILIKEKVIEDGTIAYEISGELEIDRTKHKINYGSGSFFDNLGDRAINDNVHIKFVFTAV
ncbi:MAG: YceI family protein [Bacteroidota bacterium]|nr:YceI family protein [Bacteroidota bacterium]